MNRHLIALFLALSLNVTSLAAAANTASALPFIEDDFANALAQARDKDLPLFVEAWAPW